MDDEFQIEYFRANLDQLVVSAWGEIHVIQGLDEQRANADPADPDRLTEIAELLDEHETELKDNLERMATTVLVALECLEADGVAHDLRKAWCKQKRRGLTRIIPVPEEEGHRCPAIGVILRYAAALTNCFKADVGFQYRLSRLENTFRNTAFILQLRGVDPSKEQDVKDALREYLRIEYPDLVKSPLIAKGFKNFHPDTGIASLQAGFEYKYADSAQKLKTAIGGIYEDTKGYKGSKDWTRFYAVVYTTQQFATDEEAEKMLANLEENWKVIRVLPIAPTDKK
jgi:hypothetical protein